MRYRKKKKPTHLYHLELQKCRVSKSQKFSQCYMGEVGKNEISKTLYSFPSQKTSL